MSATSPGSCSTVVTAAVEPTTKTHASPCLMFERETISRTLPVMSIISSFAAVLRLIVPFEVVKMLPSPGVTVLKNDNTCYSLGEGRNEVRKHGIYHVWIDIS